MYQGDSQATLEDKTEKKVKKRKLHKQKKMVRKHKTIVPSSSDSETDSPSQTPYCNFKFSLSQASQSFSEIFSQAQATLREHPSKASLSKYNQSELPFIQWTSDDPNPNELKRSRKKAKSSKLKKKKEKLESLPTVTDTASTPEKDGNSTEALQPFEINRYHMAIADTANLDTDTDLDGFEFDPARSNNEPESNIEEIILYSSDEGTPVTNHRYESSNLRSRSTPTRSSCSSVSVITISSRSSSPTVDNLSNSSSPSIESPPPPNENCGVPYHAGDMRIRILYRGDIHEFDGNVNWDVEKVREKLSELTNVPDTELLIYTENERKMEDGKTLKDYDIKLGEILEALRRCTENPILEGEGVIQLKFQKEGLKKPIYLSVLRHRNMKEIRMQVAKLVQVEQKKLFFRIDGVVVDLLKTPDDLELENDFCVDIFEKN